MTKKFRHPVTGQMVIVSHEPNNDFLKVETEIKKESFCEINVDKTTCDLFVESSSIAAIVFQRFNKDYAKIFVNEPEKFRSFLVSQLKHVL